MEGKLHHFRKVPRQWALHPSSVAFLQAQLFVVVGNGDVESL